MATALENTELHQGSCLCGQVRYEFSGAPLGFVFCHCRDCQTVSGGGPAAILMVPKPALRLVQGELASYAKPSDRGTLAHRRFCAQCGTQVLSETDSTPQLYFVKAGTLTAPQAFKPSANLWVRSRQPWTAIDPALKVFETQP
jgi:hypothetical protein